MIPVEQHAARTIRLATVAAELAELDQTWTALDAEFLRIADEVARQHHAGISAAEKLEHLANLYTKLLLVELLATSAMSAGLAVLQDADRV